MKNYLLILFMMCCFLLSACSVKTPVMVISPDGNSEVFFNHDMIATAAKHHLMVDFHGAYKPTGLRRTYPNMMTREGILGLEYLKWSARATPEHNVTAPFTRMLAGPMDYTPGGFRNVTKETFVSQRINPMVLTTRCHQLALFVIFESPLQMVADAPANYCNQSGLDFLQVVPASWEKTRVLVGKIGDYIAIARRSGKQWFIGALTDDNGRVLDLLLSFLDDGEYLITAWSDGANADQQPTQVEKVEMVKTNQDTLNAVMTRGGGFVACLSLNTQNQR